MSIGTDPFAADDQRYLLGQHKRKTTIARLILGGLVLAVLLSLVPAVGQAAAGPAPTATCQGEFQSVSPALTDLAGQRYVRMDGTTTNELGGLYPDGSNTRPAEHEAAGLTMAGQIEPLDASGNPDAANGRIVLLGIGMSNTAVEFREFRNRVRADAGVNPRLVVVSGAAAGQVAQFWLDPAGDNWQHIRARLRHARVTPEQVQVAWVKLTRTGGGEFPAKADLLRDDLATVARNLRLNYPNLKIIYFSSRTRAYAYWSGLSPEPAAFETGFAVKWLIEQQLEGDPGLNYDPARGPVVAPWLAWGPYLWVDGLNARSDGLVWRPSDLIADCVHPSASGIAKVADMLMTFFKSDTTARSWFLVNDPGADLPGVEVTAVPLPVAESELASPSAKCRIYRRACAR